VDQNLLHCDKFLNNVCLVASELASLKVVTNDAACKTCSSLENKHTKNYVTCSLAITAMAKAKTLTNDKLNELKQHVPTTVLYAEELSEGPGTELEKLISWFKTKDKKCKCADRVQKMNHWGPDKCKENIETILNWLEESAKQYKLPFVRFAARWIVLTAIEKSKCTLKKSS